MASLYNSEEQFSINLIKQKQPTLLACGGDYANLKNVGVENFLVTIFPFGVGGPTMKRQTKVSQKECLKKYLRTLLPHFMRGDTVQILAHMYSRILSFKTGVMIGRSNSGGKPLAERHAELTKENIESASEDDCNLVTDHMALFTKNIETSCVRSDTHQKLQS